MNKAIIWSIAGSDSGGGAGIQADIATAADFSVHICTAVTALTAQNSHSVTAVELCSPGHLHAQLDCLWQDMPPKVIKLGMLGSVQQVNCVVDFIRSLDDQQRPLIVCDPVLVSSSGKALLDAEGEGALRKSLLPLVDVLTPNVPEAQRLLNQATTDPAELAQQLLSLGAKAVLLKGGHSDDGEFCRDYFTGSGQSFWLQSARLDTPHTHGSGCCLATALAAALARDYAIADALVLAKAYVTQGIRGGVAIGQGPGPVAHLGWPAKLEDLPRVYAELPPAQPLQFPACPHRLGLYPVVDSVEWLERLLVLGVKTIQLRVKDKSTDELRTMVAAAVALQQRFDARLFINDYWQLAIEYGAYGVHLGQEDLDTADIQALAKAGLRLGVSTHSWWEIARAHGVQPSYIAIGPIYPTTTKVMKFSQQGVAQLSEWVGVLDDKYPTVAIGGINYERARDVLTSGVGSVAMVTAITLAEDYPAEVRRLLALLE